MELTLLQAYIGQGWMIFIILFYGYSSFRPRNVQNFFIYYTMLILGKSTIIPTNTGSNANTSCHTAVVTFSGWKLLKRTRFVRPHEADLVWEAPSIDAYEETFYGPPVSFWREIVQVVGIGRVKGGNDPRRGSISG